MFKKKYFIILMLLFTILFSSCGSKDSSSSKDSNNKSKNDSSKTTSDDKSTQNPVVTIEMEDGANIKIELYPKVAPNTVNNFISLVQNGFYNGLIFHRVIPGFMIQGGSSQDNGIGGPGYTIKGEFTENGFKNDLKHTRGVISMARTVEPNSAGSQFFIMVNDYPSLDGKYAAFGKVTDGMTEVDKIVNTPTDNSEKSSSGVPIGGKPLTNQKIKNVTVNTFGIKYSDIIKEK